MYPKFKYHPLVFLTFKIIITLVVVIFYNFPSATGENNPMTMLEVERITAYNMGMLPTYETTLVRVLAHMNSWAIPTTPDARWKIPTEESN